jgi:hypothetical protein
VQQCTKGQLQKRKVVCAFSITFPSTNFRINMALNLETLASETNASLKRCWDDLGVSSDERGQYLQSLAADITAIYRSRVESQELRRTQKIEEIAALESVIQNMQRAMEEPETAVRNPSLVYERWRVAHSAATRRSRRFHGAP